MRFRGHVHRRPPETTTGSARFSRPLSESEIDSTPSVLQPPSAGLERPRSSGALGAHHGRRRRRHLPRRTHRPRVHRSRPRHGRRSSSAPSSTRCPVHRGSSLPLRHRQRRVTSARSTAACSTSHSPTRARSSSVPDGTTASPRADEPSGGQPRSSPSSPLPSSPRDDLTAVGTQAEYQAFLDCYDGLRRATSTHVRGNHDAMSGLSYAAGTAPHRACPASSSPSSTRSARQRRRHHQRRSSSTGSTPLPLTATPTRRSWSSPTTSPGRRTAHTRPTATSASIPTASERLVELIARRPTIVGCFAGHTSPQPGSAAVAATGDVPYGRGRLRQGLPGHLGRVPGVRGRHPPAPSDARLPARGPGVERAVPRALRRLRRRLHGLRPRLARRPLHPHLARGRHRDRSPDRSARFAGATHPTAPLDDLRVIDVSTVVRRPGVRPLPRRLRRRRRQGRAARTGDTRARHGLARPDATA